MKAKERQVCQRKDQPQALKASKEATSPVLAAAIQINDQKLREHFGEFVCDTVEKTLNAFLEAEADRLCGAGRYERSPDREHTRAGHYRRRRDTAARRVQLRVKFKVPRLPQKRLARGRRVRYTWPEDAVDSPKEPER
ncbi:MAG: transposase [Verrucomicrobiae bacterium]|nr:transposase [Verrucomicrobiae bacterium]